MSWLRRHKEQTTKLLVGSCILVLILFGSTAVYCYRKNIAIEMERELIKQEKIMASNMEKIKEYSVDQMNLGANKIFWKGKEYRRNSYIKAILCIGIDRMDGLTETKVQGEAGQADSIFLVVQDTARNQLKVLMIPRDTIVEIAVLNPDGSIKEKKMDHLLMAYAYGDGLETSCLNVMNAVSSMLCNLPIDYYLVSGLEVIGDVTDAVGGVMVTVPTAGMEKVDPSFIKGEQVELHGKQAELFVRYRDITVDHSAIYRLNQQKEFVTQFVSSLQECSKKNSQIVTQMIEIAESHIMTNMAKEQYMKIATDLIVSDGIKATDFYMVPGTGITTEQFDEFHIEKEELISLLLELFFREDGE